MSPAARTGLLGAAVGALAALAVAALIGLFDGEDPGALPSVPAFGANRDSPFERINDVYRRASPGVVFVQARGGDRFRSPFGLPSPPRRVATGTGFVLDRQGHVLTNAHVVAGAREVGIQFAEGKLVEATLVGSDVSTDLALLRVAPRSADLRPLPLGSSRGLAAGDPVLAIGNPLGLEDTVTSGIVSALHRRITAPNGYTIEDVIQTDAPINPGNSGGPLLDFEGRVVGINAQIATLGSRGSIGIGFAIPVDTAKKVVPDLKDDGEVLRPFLGVTTVTLTPQLARQLGIAVDAGALVVAVAEGSPADRAGLRGGGAAGTGAILAGGDVLVEVAGERISGSNDVADVVADHRPGEVIAVAFVRDGERRTVRVELADRPG